MCFQAAKYVRIVMAVGVWAALLAGRADGAVDGAHFWFSTNSVTSAGPANVAVGMSVGETQTLYLWGRPTKGLQLRNVSLNVVVDAGADLTDGTYTIHNTIDGSTDRFEYLIDSSSSTVLLSDRSKAEVTAGSADGLYGWNAFTLFPTIAYRGVGPRCSSGETGCVAATDGEPAWLLGQLNIEAITASTSVDIHLQIGEQGMNEVTLADGDYDFNGTVEGADHTVWATSYGSTTLLAGDGNDDGTVNAADYTLWRDHLGDTSSLGAASATEVRFGADAGASTEPLHNASTDRSTNLVGDDPEVVITIAAAALSVPEPSAVVLLVGGLVPLLGRSRRV